MAHFEQFEAIVRELISSKQYTARALKAKVDKISIELSADLPPTQVLYSSAYGGFSFSEEFEEFYISLSQEHATNANRSNPELQKSILKLGAFILEEFPDLKHTICTYYELQNNKELAKLFEIANARVKHIDRKAALERVQQLRNLLNEPEPDKESALSIEQISLYALAGRYSCEKKYMRNFSSDARKEALRLLEEVLLPSKPAAGTEHIEAFVKAKQTSDDDDINDGIDFVQSLRHNAKANWGKQRHYKAELLQYIDYLKGNNMSSLLPEVPTVLTKAQLLEASCMLASGRYARLEYAKVPALSDWTINEYDGKESVYPRTDGHRPTYFRG